MLQPTICTQNSCEVKNYPLYFWLGWHSRLIHTQSEVFAHTVSSKGGKALKDV